MIFNPLGKYGSYGPVEDRKVRLTLTLTLTVTVTLTLTLTLTLALTLTLILTKVVSSELVPVRLPSGGEHG